VLLVVFARASEVNIHVDADEDDDDDADDEEDETIEWWILGLCPGTQNAHPIDTFTVNIY
jgi:hypothetical protein